MENTRATRSGLADILRHHRVSPTRQRVEIAYALFSRGEHLSADRLLELVNERTCAASKATVYNTLNLFVERRLIRRVIVDPARVFYDPNTAPHHHFYNVETGELTDIEESQLHISGVPRVPCGMSVRGIDVIVRIGSC